jgi:hypothetical protein
MPCELKARMILGSIILNTCFLLVTDHCSLITDLW